MQQYSERYGRRLVPVFQRGRRNTLRRDDEVDGFDATAASGSGTVAVNVVGNFLWLRVALPAPVPAVLPMLAPGTVTVPVVGAPLLSNGTVVQVLCRK